jgi:hypothetical protein
VKVRLRLTRNEVGNMKKNHDIIELECWVRGETEKAYLIETDTGKGWIPKS